MSRSEAWFLHASNVLVGGTGIVYGWMRYFAEPGDPYAVVNHPLQPDVQHLHVLVAPVFVFACGMIWRRHVWARVKSGFATRRRTGLLLFGLLVPSVVSGYAIQVVVGEGWRKIWIGVHLATCVLWILAYLVHQLSPRGEGEEPRLDPGGP